MEQSVEQKKRYGLIDTLRGFAVLNMIVYHAIWDWNSFFDLEWTWYDGTAGFVWQQFICWSFILISGFCFLFSSHPYRRGAVIFACGALVSIVTFVILPSAKIEFGILTFLGCAILLTAVLRPFLQKIPRTMGLILSIALFILTRNINDGYLGFASWRPVQIPAWFYQGRVMTYLGFTAPDFFSSDYFSIFPWYFLFLCGFFLYLLCKDTVVMEYLRRGDVVFAFVGRHALLFYILHQPLLTALFRVILALF